MVVDKNVRRRARTFALADTLTRVHHTRSIVDDGGKAATTTAIDPLVLANAMPILVTRPTEDLSLFAATNSPHTFELR